MRVLVPIVVALGCACARVGFDTPSPGDGSWQEGGAAGDSVSAVEAASAKEAGSSTEAAVGADSSSPFDRDAGSDGETARDADADEPARTPDARTDGMREAGASDAEDAPMSPDGAPFPDSDVGLGADADAVPADTSQTSVDADASPTDADAAADATDAASDPDAIPVGDAAAAPTMQSLCAFTNVVLIEGTSATDTDTSLLLAGGVAAGCSGVLLSRQVSQDTAGILDPTSGRPLIGTAELAIASGGHVPQKVVAYLEQSDSAVYDAITNNHYTIYSRAGSQIAAVNINKLSSTHDVAVIMVVREPTSQTLVLTAFGAGSEGTQAAGFYFVTTIAPHLMSDSRTYYVIEWTDQDGDTIPSSGDLFTVLGSG